MKANFTYVRVGDPNVDLAMQQVSQAFARLDQSSGLNVVQVNQSTYAAVGNEDEIVVNRTCKVTLPTPTIGWEVTIVQGQQAKSVTITTVSPNVLLDGDSPGTVTLSSPFSTAQIATDGTSYYTIGGSAAAPPIPPIPPFPPLPPIPPSPTPTPPSVTPWVAPVPYGGQNTYTSNTAGTEAWAAECIVDFTTAPPHVTAYLWFEGEDTGSNGTVRVRIGGSAYKNITASPGITVTVPNSTMTSQVVAVPMTVALGPQRVTLTTQSTSGQKLTITGVNLLFR